MNYEDTNPEVLVANTIEEARKSGLVSENEDIAPIHVMILLKIARGEIPVADAMYRIAKVGVDAFAREAGILPTMQNSKTPPQYDDSEPKDV